MNDSRILRCSPFGSRMISMLIFLCIAMSALPLYSVDQEGHKNLKHFGVVGDGRADDTAAIQRAIDSGLGSIHFPKGVYRITKPLVIELDRTGFTSLHGVGVATIRMEGPGPAVKFVGTHVSGSASSGFKDGFWERERMPLVDGLGITATHTEADGIEAFGTMQLIVSRTHIRNCRHGIRLTGNNRNVIVSDCHIYKNSGIGIYYDNVNLHQSNITGTHISYNDGGGVVSLRGNVRNIHISGCDIESNMSPDKPPTANVLIDNRESEWGAGEVAIAGCTIQHNHRAPDSANIRIIGRTKPKKKNPLVRQGNITITGNILSDVFVNVHLKDCRGVAMTGNTLWKAYRHNLLIEGCANIIVGDNMLDRNPVVYSYGDSLDARNSVVIRDSQDCTISGLHITDVWNEPAAVTMRRCSRMVFSDCMILDCDNVGLLLDNVSHSRVSGCIFRDDRTEPKMASPIKVIGGGGNLTDKCLLLKNNTELDQVYSEISESRDRDTTLPGARPDIQAIEYPNLQAALDALPEEGGVVRIPTGHFKIDQPLRVQCGEVTIVGVGAGSHIENINTTGEPAIFIQHRSGTKPKRADRLWRIRLADLRITGNPKSGHGIEAHHIQELFLQGLTVSHHGGDGIHTYYCTEDPRISDCLITYNAQTGLHIEGNHDTIVSANQFEENFNAVHCIDGYNLTMTGNNIDDHLGNGVVLDNFYGSVVSGNMIEESKGIGVLLKRGCYGVTVSANIIINNERGGIDLRSVHSGTISDNTMASNQPFGCRIASPATHLTITGNNFSGPFLTPDGYQRHADGGIALENPKNVLISGNTFIQTLQTANISGSTERAVVISENLVLESHQPNPYFRFKPENGRK